MRSASLQYATALADVALEQGAAEPVKKQLEDFGAAYAESTELRSVLGSPAVERTAKHGVIEKLATRMGASRIVRNFLFIVVDNQRTHLLPEILQAFEAVIRQRQGVAEAEVTSAAELTAPQKTQLQKTLEVGAAPAATTTAPGPMTPPGAMIPSASSETTESSITIVVPTGSANVPPLNNAKGNDTLGNDLKP